jgi:hypothetical protein
VAGGRKGLSPYRRFKILEGPAPSGPWSRRSATLQRSQAEGLNALSGPAPSGPWSRRFSFAEFSFGEFSATLQNGGFWIS